MPFLNSVAMALLKGKNVLITGGGRGIGLAFCEAVLGAGGNVGILDILPEPHPDCRALIEKEDGRCHYFVCDITDQESLESGFAKAIEAFGGTLDGCVTTAGIGTDKPFLDHTWADFNRVVAVNGLNFSQQAGTFFAAQLAVRQFLSQPQSEGTDNRGSVVLVASAAASHSCPGHLLTAYGGSKGFVRSFCTQLAHELAAEGVRVNSISPGYIDTELNRSLAQIRPEVEYYFNHAPPMKRTGKPSDLAPGLVYLLSDGASYVTGTNLTIDGGMSTGSGLTR